MFVFVSAWRYSSFRRDTLERLGETLEGSVVSVTITNFSTAIAFAFGKYTCSAVEILHCETRAEAIGSQLSQPEFGDNPAHCHRLLT